MQYRDFGNLGYKVSALGFGAIVAVTPNFFASAGDENAAEYQYRPSFTAAAPASGDEDKFAIYQEPVAAGAAGMIRLAGVAICQLLINDLADEFAAAVAADTAKLSSGQSGGARILYLETGKVATDTAWAVVRIGDGGGGGESYPDYDAGKVQLLGHDDSGVKRWYDVNDTEC